MQTEYHQIWVLNILPRPLSRPENYPFPTPIKAKASRVATPPRPGRIYTDPADDCNTPFPPTLFISVHFHDCKVSMRRDEKLNQNELFSRQQGFFPLKVLWNTKGAPNLLCSPIFEGCHDPLDFLPNLPGPSSTTATVYFSLLMEASRYYCGKKGRRTDQRACLSKVAVRNIALAKKKGKKDCMEKGVKTTKTFFS